jgi:hypothetical protein
VDCVLELALLKKLCEDIKTRIVHQRSGEWDIIRLTSTVYLLSIGSGSCIFKSYHETKPPCIFDFYGVQKRQDIWLSSQATGTRKWKQKYIVLENGYLAIKDSVSCPVNQSRRPSWGSLISTAELDKSFYFRI